MKKILIAIGFLTKIPVPDIDIKEGDLAGSMAYFPVVGLLLGLGLALINAFLAPILPSGVVNLTLVFALTALTGAIHLDGLADTIDGFCAKNKSREEILEIMRDSRIGAMGVIALVMAILLKYELLNSMSGQIKNIALVLMCSTSRWAQVIVSYFSKYAREGEGLGRPFVGNIRKQDFYLATVFAISISLFCWLPKGLLVFIIISASSWILMKYARKRIGGMTGDTIGAISEITEILALLIVLMIR